MVNNAFDYRTAHQLRKRLLEDFRLSEPVEMPILAERPGPMGLKARPGPVLLQPEPASKMIFCFCPQGRRSSVVRAAAS
jgi:hypothetical protein